MQVADYILSPGMCVERKAVPDLRQSLNSGRLFSQAEAMVRHYDLPVLLIEFEEDKAFRLFSENEVTDRISVSWATALSTTWEEQQLTLAYKLSDGKTAQCL